MRRVLKFEADLPDDQIEENGEIVEFGGMSATEVVRNQIIEQGWNAGPIFQHSDNVWCFDAKGTFGSFSFHLNCAHPVFFLGIERRSWLEDLLRRSAPSFRDGLASTQNAVIRLGGKNLRWFRTGDASDLPHATIDETMRA